MVLTGTLTDHVLFQWRTRLLAAGAVGTAGEGVWELEREHAR